MIAVMIVSGVWGLSFGGNEKPASSKRTVRVEVRVQILRNLAVSQLLLTLITFTTAHVQIITRLSSAYPVWLWYAANSLGKGDALPGIITKFMVMYAAVQGGLFASFLPPA
jgi:phosphatidylinositol glycan class V